MRLFELYELLDGASLPSVAESEFTVAISPELLDLLAKLELQPEADQEILALLRQIVPDEDNVTFTQPESVTNNYVVAPSTRALVLFVHKVLTLPRANKFLKTLLNILSLAESSSSQASLLKTSSNIVEEGDDVSETQNNRWRHLQNRQQARLLTGRGGVRRSKHMTVHEEQQQQQQQQQQDQLAASEEDLVSPPDSTPTTPIVPSDDMMPATPLTDLNRSVGAVPISEQERSDIEQRMQSSFEADGPNKDVWEQKMRPPIVGGVELQLSHKQITDPDALLQATVAPSPPSSKRKEAKKKVPYAEHQIMFPGNFFRYPVLEASQYPEVESFVELSPSRLPAWLSVCMSSSALPDSVGSSRKCVRVPLRALVMVFNSTGGELPLVETTLCQSLFRNFVLHCQEEQLLNYENYVTLIMRHFPWFANLPRVDGATDPYTKASKAEMDMFNLYSKMEELRWTADTYQTYCERLMSARGSPEALHTLLEDVERDLRNSILLNLDSSLVHVERLLINLLGHTESALREKATVLLNCLYDRHAWQIRHPFVPRVRCIDDSFSVEICFQDSISEELMNRLIVAVSSPTAGSHRQITYHVPTQYGNSLLVELSSFKRAGFYDWSIGYVSSTGIHFYPLGGFVPPSEEDFWTDVREQLVESHGRFVVHPAIRQDIFHEIFVDIEGAVWDRINGGPVKRFGTFGTVRRALDDYVENDGITAIYVMGAQERAEFGRGHPFSPIDRSSPNRASGGLEMFVELMKAAKERSLKVLVDATARISIRGAHRRYRGLNCSVVDTESGMLHVAHASDGGEQTWTDCQQINYRKQASWDIYIADILAWAALGVDGVRIESAHCCPLILRPDSKELERLDCDGQFHYPLQEIVDGDIILPATDEAHSYGYYGTRACEEGYPNPFFVKMTSAIWQAQPEFIFTAEVYWNRQRNAIASGLIPFSTGISQALSSVFGTGRRRDGAFGRLPYRRDVKAFYDWYEMERTTYPQNSLVMYASSNHYCPYPVTLYGRGAWSAVDLLYFLPEVPSTFVGEHGGWSFEYDMGTNSFRRSGIDHSFSSLAEIRGHYVHRVRLRKRVSVLNDGGLILLYAKVNDKTWHDRVFAFARFKLDKMAIIAINFNDVESTFYIDYSPLRRLFGPGNIYKREDLINPHHQPMYFSLEELLNERQQVTLQPYKSMCWGIYKEIDSPAARRVLFEHSFRRLAANLEQGVDPAHNLVYSDFQTSFREGIDQFDQFVDTLTQQLPRTSLNLFPALIRNATALSVKTTEEESKLLATLEYLRAKKEQLSAARSTESALLVNNIYEQILQCNRLGPLVFVTPEIGRFSKVGGIAVMVDELTQALQALGCEVILISPYYNYDRKGATGYLKSEGVTHLTNMVAFVGNEPIEVGVHELRENGITYYFIHHFEYFPTPYHAGSSVHQLKTIVLMAKASLELCCQLRILPAVIISNDWFTGLVPAYGRKSSAFGTTFEGVTFFHLVHNLEEGYEGKIYLDGSDHLGYIHHLPREIVVDPSCEQLCLNASRCALLACNQWGTVSKSYCKDLMEGLNPSPLRQYLAAFPQPFAHSNGVRVDQRLEELKDVATSRAEAKAKLQVKYFGKADPTMPLLSFVGRICLQKGVHLILNAVRELIDTHSGRIQIIVGGMANYKDPYAAQCAWTMQGLRNTYADNFWADPNEFFTDGPLLNMGSDFALMPSLFEPSGVVQQEYFLGGTPVIAFKTGGLKDTVFEGPEGNGFTFEAHTHRDYVEAVNRALRVFKNSADFEALCQRARESVLDMEVVAQAWAREFSRLRKCIWYDRKQVAQQLALLQEERPLAQAPQPSF